MSIRRSRHFVGNAFQEFFRILLEQVRLLLENQYENVVTYEDPVWNWIADSYAVGNEPGGPFGRLLWDRKLDLPAGVARGENGKLDADLVQGFVDAYHQQNPNDARFKVLQSSLGLHIVPAQVHDESGALVVGSSVLETRIEVPLSLRMPSEHFRAICKAIAGASGTRVDLNGPWLDQAFAPNGRIPPKAGAILLSPTEKEPYSFAWGISNVSAREALIELIAPSKTTLSWALLCSPSLKPENRSCTLNPVPLTVTRKGPDGKPAKEYLTYDR